MTDKIKVLLVIPCFNESKNILNVYKEITTKISSHDYIFINDASTDDTVKILKENNLKHINLVNNIGIANVVQFGYKYGYENGYDAVVTIDGDGQHNPIYIDSLLKELENGYDYVIGSRFINERKPINARMIGSRLLSIIIKMFTGRKIMDPTSGMKVVGKNVLKSFAKGANFVAEPDTLVYLIRNKYKIKEVQVKMEERVEGESHFSNIYKSIKFMVYVIVSIIFIQWREVERVK